VKVEHVFADQNKFVDALLHEQFQHFAFELHDVVVECIVPLTHHLDDGKSFLVIGEEDFDVEGIGTEMVPLRMDVIVVHGFVEVELVVLAVEKRRSFVGRGRIQVDPSKVGFEVVHGAKIATAVGFTLTFVLRCALLLSKICCGYSC